MLDIANNFVKHKKHKFNDNVSMNLQDRINYLFTNNPDKKAAHLAQFAGISRGAVSDWRNGKVKSITAENALCGYFFA